jgi:hypothetical protein
MNRTLGQIRRKRFSLMRAAKERKRLASQPTEREPRIEKFHRMEVTVKDRLTGESGSAEIKSARHAARLFQCFFGSI